MQILQKSSDRSAVTIKPENLDDLWELSHIIKQGHTISAYTERKIAVGGDRSKQVRKPMRLTGEVVDVELQVDILRIQVVLTEGPDEWVSHGDHHSFSITAYTEFELTATFDSISWQRLESTTKHAPHDILIVTFDREEAWIAQLTRRGYNVLQTIKGDVAKKAPGGGGENFYKTLAQVITELDERMKLTSIIVASPAFWNEYLINELPDSLKKKTTSASCSAVGESALAEVLARDEVRGVLKQDQTAQEQHVLDRILEAVSADKAAYGIDECEQEAVNGRIEELAVSCTYIEQAREQGTYSRLDALLQQAKSTSATVHLLAHVTKQLDSLGGIAGILRW